MGSIAYRARQYIRLKVQRSEIQLSYNRGTRGTSNNTNLTLYIPRHTHIHPHTPTHTHTHTHTHTRTHIEREITSIAYKAQQYIRLKVQRNEIQLNYKRGTPM